MDNNIFQRLKELVDANQAIGVVVSANPTFDQMAAALGLYLSLVQMKKNATIVCPTDPTVELSSLVGIDKVQKSFAAGGSGNGDLIVAFPYKEGEIEKVSYNVDNGKLQIVVKAGHNGLSFHQSDVTFTQNSGTSMSGSFPTLLFFVGVADAMQMGFQKTPGITVVNIDNRSQNTKYGDVVHVDSRFTSLSEEVADFLTLLEPQIELDVDSSQNLLSGILAATNDFQNGQGSYLAFEMAGILMKKGAVRSIPGAVARPTATPMESSNYFPPQQPAPAPQFQQPVQQFSSAPQQPGVNQQPVQQQQSANDQPPSDWLMPKVYKGSTAV